MFKFLFKKRESGRVDVELLTVELPTPVDKDALFASAVKKVVREQIIQDIEEALFKFEQPELYEETVKAIEYYKQICLNPGTYMPVKERFPKAHCEYGAPVLRTAHLRGLARKIAEEHLNNV